MKDVDIINDHVPLNDITPRGSQVLIKRTSCGAVKSDLIVIPESSMHYDDHIAEVIKVGPGELFISGYREKVEVKPGDKVFCWPGYGALVNSEENAYMVDITEIDGVLTDE